MHCFACHREIPLRSGERVGLRDACPCGADLHVCRNCSHHDPAAHNECREPSADRVPDRDRANRCDWFAPRSAPPSAAPGSDRDALEKLFKKGPRETR